MKTGIPFRSRHSALTLLETLAAMAVMVILAVLTSQGIRSVSHSAERAKSLGNLRKIVTAMHQYAGENEDKFPPAYYYNPAERKELTYVTELVPYLSEKPDSLNPGRNIFVSPTSALKIPAQNKSFIPFTYSVHGVICGDTSLKDERLRRSQIPRPSQVILIGDGAQNPNSLNARASFSQPEAFLLKGSTRPLNTLIPTGPNADTSAGNGYLRYRSDGRTTVAMVDGHAEVLKMGDVTYANVIAER